MWKRITEIFGVVASIFALVAIVTATPASTARDNLQSWLNLLPDWILLNAWSLAVIFGALTVGIWLIRKKKNWLLDFFWTGEDRHEVLPPNSQSLQNKGQSINSEISETPKTLFQLFHDGFGFAFKFNTIKLATSDDKEYEILPRVHLDFNSGSKFVSCYMPCGSAFVASVFLAQNVSKIITELGPIKVASRKLSDTFESKCDDLMFTGKVFIYHEDHLTVQEKAALENIYKNEGLILQLRGQEYARTVWLQKMAMREL